MANDAGGFLVIFDGIDGVGKSTQLRLANEELSQRGLETFVTHNLGGTEIGDELHRVIKLPIERPPETDLYISVAVQEALVREIDRQREADKLILMDRGPMSLATYEIFGSGLSGDLAWPYVDKGIKRLDPELVIVYLADPEMALNRAREQKTENSGSDYFEKKPLDYFKRVAQGYEVCAKRYPNVVTIQADDSIESIHEQTMRVIDEALAKHA